MTAPGPREKLDAPRLRAAVGARWPRVAVVEQTHSTSADLLADAAAPDRCVLVAEYQSGGRGRLDRSWVSPARAGLTFSVLLRPGEPMMYWGWLPLLTGVAVHEAIGQTTGVLTALKWPNDLLAATADKGADGPPDPRHKLAGVLAQAGADGLVLGVGLNVSTTRAELPVQTATSLLLCGARAVDRTELLAAILKRLDARYAQWSDCRGDAEACGLAAAYRAACATLGARVTITGTGGDVFEGVATDVDAGGRLRVSSADGERTVAAGDVEHLRRT